MSYPPTKELKDKRGNTYEVAERPIFPGREVYTLADLSDDTMLALILTSPLVEDRELGEKILRRRRECT